MVNRIFHHPVHKHMIRRSFLRYALRNSAALTPLTKQLLTGKVRNQGFMPQPHRNHSFRHLYSAIVFSRFPSPCSARRMKSKTFSDHPAMMFVFGLANCCVP